jgi:tripartite-type tricarboxylate transporter receptor subunit TctC
MWRLALIVSAAIAAAAWLAPAVAQQTYPSKPVRIISPFAPGGGNDALCRIVAHRLAEELKQQVIVENRAGANGIVGTEVAARSAPDGYTIALIPSGHAVNATLYRKLPFDSIRDFAPITLAGSSPLVVAVHPSLPVKDVKGLVALARARPGQLTYVSAGVGASGHLGGALFESLTDTKMVHIPYKGMSVAITDLMSGQVTLTFGTSLSVIPHVHSGRLRALTTTGARRSPALPDLPTVAEAGVPGYEATTWTGIVGPVGLPKPIVARLNGELVKAVASPTFREKAAAIGSEAVSSTPEQFGAFVRSEYAKWGEVVRRSGAKID